MNIINVDEARSQSGFASLNGTRVASKAFHAIKQGMKNQGTSTSVEFPRHQLQKYSIKEGRAVIEDQGFLVNVTDEKGLVKLHISWFFPADKEQVLVI